MKKYFIFMASFILLFLILNFGLELLLGSILTFFYVPNVGEAWGASAEAANQVTLYGSTSLRSFSLVVGLVAASLAYLIAQKFPRYS